MTKTDLFEVTGTPSQRHFLIAEKLENNHEGARWKSEKVAAALPVVSIITGRGFVLGTDKVALSEQAANTVCYLLCHFYCKKYLNFKKTLDISQAYKSILIFMWKPNSWNRRLSCFPFPSISACGQTSRGRMARRLHPKHFPILHCSPNPSILRNESYFYFYLPVEWRAVKQGPWTLTKAGASQAAERLLVRVTSLKILEAHIHTLARLGNICKQEKTSLTLMAAVVRVAPREKIRQKVTHKACFYAEGVKQRFTALLNPARPRLHPPPAPPSSTRANSIIIFLRIV